MSNTKSSPLVSIVVITYNSSKFVVETLESIKSQTYPYLELIISDDHSTDETLSISRKWAGQYRSRFNRIKILESPVNTGISPNANRGYKEAKGMWIKAIAGDDILCVDCIEEFMNNIKDENSLYFSKMKIFGIGNNLSLSEQENYWNKSYSIFNLPREEQIQHFLYSGNFAPSPSLFVAKKTIFSLGLFDERIKLCEDMPLYHKALHRGVPFVLIEKELVKYRLSYNSVQINPLAQYSIMMYNAIYIRRSYLKRLYAGIFDQLHKDSWRNSLGEMIKNIVKIITFNKLHY